MGGDVAGGPVTPCQLFMCAAAAGFGEVEVSKRGALGYPATCALPGPQCSQCDRLPIIWPRDCCRLGSTTASSSGSSSNRISCRTANATRRRFIHTACSPRPSLFPKPLAMASESLSDVMYGQPFSMLPLLGPDSPALVALRSDRLHPRDLALLWVLIQHVDWRTGRIWMNHEQLAAAMGHQATGTVVKCITRLKAEGLVARGRDKRDPRRWFWCLNPMTVASSGGKHRRTVQILQFEEAAERAVLNACNGQKVAARHRARREAAAAALVAEPGPAGPAPAAPPEMVPQAAGGGAVGALAGGPGPVALAAAALARLAAFHG